MFVSLSWMDLYFLLWFVVEFELAFHSVHRVLHLCKLCISSFLGLGINFNPFLSASFCVSLRVCFDNINFWLSLDFWLNFGCCKEQLLPLLHKESEYGCIIYSYLLPFFLYVLSFLVVEVLSFGHSSFHWLGPCLWTKNFLPRLGGSLRFLEFVHIPACMNPVRASTKDHLG